MKLNLKTTKEVNVTTIAVKANVRYWEDATINGVADEYGDLTPFAHGDTWNPKIDIEKGAVIDWPSGTVADIHFKICDGCGFDLLDSNGKVLFTQDDGYVPKMLCPEESGYGDYMIMKIDENGKINKWDAIELKNVFRDDD
jgi:hypothetical protein